MRRLTRRQRLSAIVLAVLALLFISFDFAGGSLGGTRSGTTGALGSLYRGTDAVLGPVRRFVQGVPDVGGNRREIAQLKRRNADLQRLAHHVLGRVELCDRIEKTQHAGMNQVVHVYMDRQVLVYPDGDRFH